MSAFGTPRAGALASLIAAVLVGAALLVAGLRTLPVRTFALQVPDSQPPVAVAGPQRRVCEGPVRSDGAFQSVGIFGMYASGAPVVGVDVRTPAGRRLASGSLTAIGHRTEHLVTLDRAVPGSTAVEVCVIVRYGRFSLLGAASSAPGVATVGVHRGQQFALVLTRRSSLLGSLQTAFSRAAIFRPSWIGAWTFWVLLGFLVAGGGLLAVAVTAAVGADEKPPASR